MDNAKLRAWWAHRQGLDGSLRGATPAEVLSRSGWARSVGGAGPYLTLFARARTSRADADAAVASASIHELPAARGCTYVLPAADFALALAVGDASGDGDMKQALKLGVTENEIDVLCDAVLKALRTGVLAPDEIRDATGSASRSLGEEGKKKGIGTTLPLALGRLQARGDIGACR
ncbi:MAG: crosslink repair DNA glycosylase YcaQ family protein [Gemmatimonadaceae bacterium]